MPYHNKNPLSMVSQQEQEVINALLCHLQEYHSCIIEDDDPWKPFFNGTKAKIVPMSKADTLGTVRIIKTDNIDDLIAISLLIQRAYILPPVIIIPESTFSQESMNLLGYYEPPIRLQQFLLFNEYKCRYDGRSWKGSKPTFLTECIALDETGKKGIMISDTTILWSNGSRTTLI